MENNICRVAKINTSYQVVLNSGLKDGVKIGSIFEIFSLGEMVIDPVTNEELEINEIFKGKGRVITLQNKICTIESIDYEEKRKTIIKKKNPAFSSLLTGLGSYSDDEIRQEIDPEKLPFKSVQIGDYARIIKW